jgi:hypothetical protein
VSALLARLLDTALTTARDVLPIAAVLLGFQLLVLRRPVPHLRRVLAGFGYVLVGLTLFLVGLEEALFPLGRLMAAQLTSPAFLGAGAGAWHDYLWVYGFAAALAFATALAEPALIAVAMKAHAVSGGAIGVWGLRIAVGLGAAIGIALGTLRIVTGVPIHWFIIGIYALVIVQTVYAPRNIVALAYDSGGVTTSTVTVPLVAALGLGLAATVPGRSPLLDGFGLIAFVCSFPIVTVMGYAQLAAWRARRAATRQARRET